LEELLIAADMGITTAAKLRAQLEAEKFDKEVDGQEIRTSLAAHITALLQPLEAGIKTDPALKPNVILVIGVNGTGKTTTIGKMAKRLSDDGQKVMVAAGDTFRAAAKGQLRIWAERSGVVFFEKEETKDPAALAYEAVEQAKAQNCNVLMIDTAGRLHNKSGLMDELTKIDRVLKKIDETAPHQCWLVLDATTGQNAIQQAENFGKAVKITGLIVTKLDGTARGGVLVAIADKLKLPILAIGVGESIDDLESFKAADFARNLLGL
jgi:fused signal recognition particle receptor